MMANTEVGPTPGFSIVENFKFSLFFAEAAATPEGYRLERIWIRWMGGPTGWVGFEYATYPPLPSGFRNRESCALS